MYIIDRRLNAGGKSLPNRQRFLRRAKALVQRAVADKAAARGITDIDSAAEVAIPRNGIGEPRLRRASAGGFRDYVLPGNKKFLEGDTLERPPPGAGRGSEAGEGEGEDDFRFVLTRDEFLELFLDDLDLPNLAKRRVLSDESFGMRRAGYAVTGSPANLALTRTIRNSLARRVAMKRPSAAELNRLEDEIAGLAAGLPETAPEIAELRERLERLNRRTRRIPYIDPIDLRYRRFEPVPRPVTQAVMFCLMDVSGSMTEHMKDLAKRFYMLLYVFLKHRYRRVDIVFVRHTHEAKEVDEETFFNSPETGGTLVSSALLEMKRIVGERYSPSNWNIYAAQASDGDNSASDRGACTALLRDSILPVCQHFAYLEVGADDEGPRIGFAPHATTLWQTYEALAQAGSDIAMRKVNHRSEIYPVFRDLFRRRGPPIAQSAL
ncbi:YeaH/YhbH family protein [Microvirga antarctica]|uniref:YeaH/YhbH family protein n=1 Tax=Microvirga antarctica TaxID=2819233 RepID=UPI001B306632|nr:YeaH/YhbH family protein [Microvirga antarctica]